MLLAGCTPDNSLADFAVTTQQTNGTRPRQPRSTFQADWLFHRGEWKPIDDPLPEGIDFEKQLTAAGFTESHKSETSCPFVEIFRSERGKAPYQFCVVFGDFGEQWGTVYINDLPSLLQLMQMAGPLMLLDQMYADYFSRERADR